MGSYCEFSRDLLDLIRLVAEAQATRLEDEGLPHNAALSMSSWITRRRWAFTATRSLARTKIAGARHAAACRDGIGPDGSGRRRKNRSRKDTGSMYDRWNASSGPAGDLS